MNKKRRLTKKQWHLLFWPLLALIPVLVIIWSPRGLLHLRQLYGEHRELTQKNLTLEKQNRRLYQQIDRLLNDPSALEDLARKELGLVKEGELIFQFTPSGDSSNRSSK